MAVLEADLRLALDRVAFWREADIGEPLPWQERALVSEAPMQLYNCARQSGKSQVAAALAVHKVLYTPEALVLMVSRTLDHSGELFKRALKIYRDVGRPVEATSETALSLTLENYTADLLLIDEAARVANDLYVSATPILARTGGRIVALSSPFGNRGWFYEEWRSNEPWDRYRITADDLPEDWYKPDKATFLSRERRRLGEWWFRQEFYAEFLEGQTQGFRREDIEAAFSEELEAWAL
jgi:hypothetical protein